MTNLALVSKTCSSVNTAAAVYQTEAQPQRPELIKNLTDLRGAGERNAQVWTGERRSGKQGSSNFKYLCVETFVISAAPVGGRSQGN